MDDSSQESFWDLTGNRAQKQPRPKTDARTASARKPEQGLLGPKTDAKSAPWRGQLWLGSIEAQRLGLNIHFLYN